VILAGLFREYDQESLLHEPWHLGIPLAASLGLSALLFVILKAIPAVRHTPLSKTEEFRRLLTCFWMTAPLAVIYAIPVERLTSAAVATGYNMLFLGIVATWRVILFVRVVSVLYYASYLSALFPVLLLADSLVIWLMFVFPLPLLQVMGGIRLTESERLINEVRAGLLFVGGLSWPVWLIGTGVVALRKTEYEVPAATPSAGRVSGGLWACSVVAAALVLGACLITQPEQQRRHRIERLLKGERFDEALDLLTAIPRSDLPPHWDPPPRVRPWRMNPEPLSVVAAILDRDDVPGWVVDAYGDKLVQWRGFGYHSYFFWKERTNQELRILVAFLSRFPQWSTRIDPVYDEYRILGFIREALDESLQPSDSPERFSPELLLQLLDLSSESESSPSAELLRERLQLLIEADATTDP
jgi:hypothetical protein